MIPAKLAAIEAEQNRRALNIFAALVALVLAAPVMVAVAVLVRLTSRGPVFFGQTRVGLDGRRDAVRGPAPRRLADVGGQPFTIYKFRTMFVHKAEQVWAAENDPRITPLGRVLRKYRLDELPQLFNV